MPLLAKIYNGWKRFLELLLILAEFLLALRFAMKFLSANVSSFVIDYLYRLTDILIWPFNFIFPNLAWQNHLVDMIAVSAMSGYLIAFFVLLGVSKFLFR